MGGCSGKEQSPYEEFTVTNINDQHRLVHSGIMFVTETDLIYIDKKSHEKWEWPLRYLRRYGCEGFVFSFEAGRKCPSGEGLYAFNCKKANGLFNRVARNISQGNLEPTEPELPERNTEVPFPPKVQQQTPSNVPNGTTRDPNSAISPISVPTLPPPLPPTPPPSNQNGQSNVNYTPLAFEKESDDRLPPIQGDRVNYTKIDMTKTIEVSRLRHGNSGLTRRQTTGALPNKKKSKGGSRSSSCSSSSSLNTDHQQLRLRSLDDGNAKRGSAPDIRLLGQTRTSPPLMPATVTEAPGENDAEVQKSTGEPNYLNISVGTENQHTYSNMNIGGGVEQEQNYANITVGTEEHNYTNISVGMGEVSEVPTTRPSISGVLDSEHNYTNITVGSGAAGVGGVDTEHNYTNISVGTGAEESQCNYQNLIPGQGLVSSTPVTTPTQRHPPSLSPDPISPGFIHPRSSTFNHHTKPSGATLNSTQTLPHIKGGGNTMQTYIELDINSRGSASMGSYAELDVGGHSTTTLVDERQRSHSAIVPTVPAVGHTIPEDTHDTLYKELNFKEMEALHELVKERQHLKEVGDTPPTHVELSEKELKKQSKSKK